MVQDVNIGAFLKTYIKMQSKGTANTHFSGTDASTVFERISECVQI